MRILTDPSAWGESFRGGAIPVFDKADLCLYREPVVLGELIYGELMQAS